MFLFYAIFKDKNKGLPRFSVRSISLYASAGVHIADNSIVRLKVKEAIRIKFFFFRFSNFVDVLQLISGQCWLMFYDCVYIIYKCWIEMVMKNQTLEVMISII